MIKYWLLASVALTSGVDAAPYVANQQQVDAATLLLPFTTYDSTAEGQALLDQNLATSIAVNNNADAARRQRALNDILIDGQYGWQFTEGLGSRISSAYRSQFAINDTPVGPPALYLGSDPRIGAITTAFSGFTGVTGAASAFVKTYLANGKYNNTDEVINISLPPGGIFATYDARYLPQQPNDPAIPLNPNGNSRPYQVRPAAIDQFALAYNSTLTNNSAIPSGHTTYGWTESLLEALAAPERFQQEIVRAFEYGESRAVVGAHYVLDTIAGRILATQQLAGALNNLPTYTNSTLQNAGGNTAAFDNYVAAFRGIIADTCGASVAVCAASPDTTRFGDYTTNKARVTYLLTYGLPSIGDTTLAPVVPAGAEVLLATRFPYLSTVQRRDVLASTELPSGVPLDNGSGWARLNLFAAGGGYGAFDGTVVISQDAAQGGFAAADTFSNSIGGTGSLTHSGSGLLTLTGANTYSGGTTIASGTIAAASTSALGTGDVLVDGGELRVLVPGLTIFGNYTQSGAGTLELAEVGGTPVSILGNATLAGMLDVDLSGLGLGVGQYQLLSFANETGMFDDVDFIGLRSGKASLIYGQNGVYLNITSVPEPSSWALLLAGFGAIGLTARKRTRGVGRATC